jgi:hypothetical protein
MKSTLATLCFVTLAVACQRKAPGPDECHRLAVRWVEATRPFRNIGTFGRRRIALPPAEDDAVLERTTRCLTTPYDREFVACVDARRDVLDCYRAFEFRHGRGLAPVE